MTVGGAWAHVMLLSSLPALPHFTRAKSLPISAERLRSRFGMLAQDDAAMLNRAWEFVRWRRGASAVTDARLVEDFERLDESSHGRLIRECVTPRLEVLTVLAALRRRRDGEATPPATPWGIGDLIVTISRHWSHPDFGLAGRMPWLPQARVLLEQDEFLALERLLLTLAWGQLETVDRSSAYALKNVVIYVLKWDILERWLSMDPARAAARFDALLEQVLHDEFAAIA